MDKGVLHSTLHYNAGLSKKMKIVVRISNELIV